MLVRYSIWVRAIHKDPASQQPASILPSAALSNGGAAIDYQAENKSIAVSVLSIFN